MESVFQLVYAVLKWIESLTGFTYQEVNIIAYYLILPLAYLILADRILKRHIFKLLYLLVIAAGLFLIQDFTAFSDWLFQKSVTFLRSFRFLGWNYVVSSVLICVVLPGIVFMIMLHKAYPNFFRRIFHHFIPWEEP